MGDDVLSLVGVGKRFRLGGDESLVSRIGHRLLGRARSTECLWALRDVDLSVARSESVGIVGPNGAGKSTLMKILAGVLFCDAGRVRVRGKLAALLEVGAGFHPDLTGRENVYLQGAILGMDRATVCRRFDEIVEFAGLQRFIDVAVKRYSSGMYARLAFSVAAHVEPDVLLVDEVLSVGDAMFRLRCMQRMQSLVHGGVTLLFVTHQIDQMISVCQRCIVLADGRMGFDGPARQAAGYYLDAMSRAQAPRSTDLHVGHDGACVADVGLVFRTTDGRPVTWAMSRNELVAELRFRLRSPVRRLVIELNMRTPAGERVLSFNSGRDGTVLDLCAGEHCVRLGLMRLGVQGGHYLWNVRMWDASTSDTLVDTPMRFPLVVDDEGKACGAFIVEHDWTVEPIGETSARAAEWQAASCGAAP